MHIRTSEDARRALHSLLRDLGLRANMKGFEAIGRALGARTRGKPYHPKYIMQIHHGTHEASEVMKEALRWAIDHLNSTDIFRVEVLAHFPNARGAQVGGRVLKCSVCESVFVSNHPRRMRCFLCGPPRYSSF